MQKAKTEGKKAGEESAVSEEIIVQRKSSDVSGKQQKYTRNGPQEYVPFEHEELSIANIKDACMKYFRPRILFATCWLARAGHLAKRWPTFQTEKFFMCDS